MSMLPKLPVYIGWVFGLFLFCLAAKEAVILVSAAVLIDKDVELERDWEFDTHLKNVDALLEDAGFGIQAFSVSGNRALLPDTMALRKRYEAALAALESPSDDNASRQKISTRLRELTSRHLQLLEAEIAAFPVGDPRTLSPSVPQSMGPIRENIDALHRMEAALEAQQSASIRLRETEIHERYWHTLMFCLGACFAFMMLLVLFYKMNRKYAARLHISENRLKERNDDLTSTISLRAEQLTELSHHLIAVSEQEKASLARELHDELGSNLVAIRLDLLAVLEHLKDKDSCLANHIRKALQVLQKTFDIKRRIIENLRPSTLKNLGLAVAVRDLSDEVAQRSNLQIDVRIDGDPTGIDPSHAIAMYRIVQESLTNIVKYAKAKQVSISLTRNERGLLLRISDDGIGITKNNLGKAKSHGIVGMRERATLLGGSFDVHSDAKGRGTHIDVFLPYAGTSGIEH